MAAPLKGYPLVLQQPVIWGDMDAFGHVNNTVYIGWLEQCAWAHSAAVGFPETTCIEMARGMAVRKLSVASSAFCPRPVPRRAH